MKKVLLSAVAVLGLTFANAQEGTSFKPEAGNVVAEMAVTGLINNISVNLQDQAFGNGAMIKGRYFKEDGKAYRALVFLAAGSTTDNSSGDEVKTSNTGLGLGFGIEKHFEGTDRLSPYVGGDAIIGFSSQKTTTTPSGGGSVVEVKGPGTFRIGVRGVFGADYYFAQKLYLGVEAGLGLFYNSTGDTEATSGGTTVTTEGGSSISITPSVVGGIRLGYVLF